MLTILAPVKSDGMPGTEGTGSRMVDPIGTEVEHQTEPLVGSLTLKHGWKRGSRKGAKTRREEEGGERRCLECLTTLRLERSGREVHGTSTPVRYFRAFVACTARYRTKLNVKTSVIDENEGCALIRT